MNQNPWGNDVNMMGPGPMMGPPYFMDGPPMPMSMGGPPLPPGPLLQGLPMMGTQMPGPQMPGPQMPGPQMPGPQMPGPQIPGPMGGATDIDSVTMEDHNVSNENQQENRSMGVPRNNRSTEDKGNKRLGMSVEKHDLRDLSSRDNRERDRNSDRQRRRSRDRSDRSDRNRGDRGDRSGARGGDRRDRRSKWDSDAGVTDMSGLMGPGGIDMAAAAMMGPNNMMPGQAGGLGGMMYQNNMYNMQQQQMDMPNAPNMTRNMGTMQPMLGTMPQMLGNNMMMDQSMAMMNPMHGGMMNPMVANMGSNMPMITPNQPIYLNSAVLLPPLPNTQTPDRRERPNGCRTIFIGGLPEGMREEPIWEIFQRFGKISNVKLNRKGFCHLQFESMDSVEPTFCLSGCRFKYHDQPDTDALSIFIDYALNRDDQQEYERQQQKLHEPTPPPIEPFSATNLVAVGEKIKSEDKFAEAAPSLVHWLERGECNKRNVSVFYSLIQASNNQVRRLFNEKMAVDEELNNLKSSLREKFQYIITQFEQVSKILNAAKLQRVWDLFTKQQRRNIEMWQKMTVELGNMREEFNALFDEEEDVKPNKKSIALEKYEELKREYDELTSQLEGYKNEAFVIKDEAERRFEKFKAHFIAQQALQNNQPYHPLPPPPPMPPMDNFNKVKVPPPPPPEDNKPIPFTGAAVSISEGRLISLITAFLLVHPLGANLDYIHSYVRSLMPKVNQATVHNVLQKYGDVFTRKSSGVGATIDHKWLFCTFDDCKARAV